MPWVGGDRKERGNGPHGLQCLKHVGGWAKRNEPLRLVIEVEACGKETEEEAAKHPNQIGVS